MPDFDIRRGLPVEIPVIRKQQARGLEKRLGVGTTVSFNVSTGGVRHLFRTQGFLSQARGVSPRASLDQFLVQNLGVFGLLLSEISSYRTIAQETDRRTGITHLYLQQELGGLQVFQNSIKAHVSGAGEIISIEGNYFPGAQQDELSPQLSAKEAVLAAMRSSVPDLLEKTTARPARPRPLQNQSSESLIPIGTPLEFPAIREAGTGADRLTLFEPGPFVAPIRARLVIFPFQGGSSLAWEVYFHAADRQAAYTLLIDADSGILLYRHNGYKFAANSNASIFPKNPDASPLATAPFYGDPVSSPIGWSFGTSTIGNNVWSSSATSSGDFVFSFTNGWKTGGINAFDLVGKKVRFTPADANATRYSVSILAAAAVTPGVEDLVPFLSPGPDDGTANFSCPSPGFAGKIFGQTFTDFWVNSNGSISFGSGSTSLFPQKTSFGLGPTMVAGLWLDLDLTTRGTLTGSCLAEGSGRSLHIAWIDVPLFGTTMAQTFSITFHGVGSGLDNVIDIDFNTVDTTSGMLVGVGGGPSGQVTYADLSVGFSPFVPGGAAQTFPDQDLNLSITNASYHLNWMHDYFYQLGFTENLGNYQVSNFDRGGASDDPVLAEVQYDLLSFAYGATGFNNAFFVPAPDGSTGFTAYGLWNVGGSCGRRDSALDAGVIRHEYTHGVTTRVVGGPLNHAALSSLQGGALGEGWSDIFAASTLDDPVIGAYMVCNPTTGIRSVAYDASLETYADFGNKAGPYVALVGGSSVSPGLGQVFVPQVHRDGEIWASAMWDVRTALSAPIAERLIFEALRYTPVEPSMVDARNAIIIADTVLYGASHVATLYGIFAARGLGVSASSSSALFTGGNGWDTVVFAAFDTPSNPYGTAQLVLFEDDFDHGLRSWSQLGTDELWHYSSRRASSGSLSLYYGQDDTGNYDTGARNWGALISPPIKLPNVITNSAITLEWDQFKWTEDFLSDGGWVRIVDVATGSRTQVAFVQGTQTWPGSSYTFERLRVNLNQFAGETIQVEFFIDTFDSLNNAFEGWYIDNVRISVLGVPRNAGFENGAVAPWMAYGTVNGGMTSSAAHSGSFSVTESSGDGGFFQDVSGLVPGQVYSIGAWVRSSADSASATPAIFVHDTTGAGSATASLGPVGTAWQLIQVNFTATATGKVRVHLHRMNGTGSLFWDDVAVGVGSAEAGNSGFEGGALPPWITFGSVVTSLTSSTTYNGNFSLAESGGHGGVFQDVSGLVPGQIYQITARARFSSGTGEAALFVHDTTAANAATDGFRVPSTSFFEQFTVNFVATTTGAVRIHLVFSGGTGTVFWDDVRIVRGGATPLLINRSFESGTSGWRSYGSVTTQSIISSTAHTGSLSFQQATTAGGGGIFQDVAGLIPGQTYRISVWVLGDPVGTGAPVLWVHDTQGNGVTSVGSNASSSWQFLELFFTATTTGKVRIHLHLFPGTGAVDYDDVMIRQ